MRVLNTRLLRLVSAEDAKVFLKTAEASAEYDRLNRKTLGIEAQSTEETTPDEKYKNISIALRNILEDEDETADTKRLRIKSLKLTDYEKEFVEKELAEK